MRERKQKGWGGDVRKGGRYTIGSGRRRAIFSRPLNTDESRTISIFIIARFAGMSLLLLLLLLHVGAASAEAAVGSNHVLLHQQQRTRQQQHMDGGDPDPDSSEPDETGPRWVTEPPNRADFSNSTGLRLECAAEGRPQPTVEW